MGTLWKRKEIISFLKYLLLHFKIIDEIKIKFQTIKRPHSVKSKTLSYLYLNHRLQFLIIKT